MNQIDVADELRKIRARDVEVGTTTLLKTDTLRVVLMNLRAGGRLHEHHADGRMILQILEGEVEFDAEGAPHRLGSGMLASVGAMVPHSVTAISDSVLLLTIAWPRAEEMKVGAHRDVGYN